MSFAVLARPAVSRQVLGRARSLHTSSPLRSDHGGHYHPTPFDWPAADKKTGFGLKVLAYLSAGFAIPFVAAKYQLVKSQGA